MNAKQLAEQHGMLSPDEVELLQECVKLLPAQPLIVNIGANVGTSTCAMLEANPRAYIFSIDLRPYEQERQNVEACGLDPDRVIRVLGDSNEIGLHWSYKADLIFVDGGHHDTAVKGDIEVWQPRCKSVMLFHDYNHPNYVNKPGVNLDAIVDEAMKDWRRLGQARYLVAFKR